MDAYILGTHDGDLPTHLLGQGEDGHRVRAMARLDGPDHNVFYALEAPDEESFQIHVDTITASGSAVIRWMIRCIAENCFGALEIKPFSIWNISHMPPYLLYEFFWLEQEHIRDEVAALRDVLGHDGVAAATDGRGNFLVEIGSDDPEQIAAAAAVLSGSSRHAVSGEILR